LIGSAREAQKLQELTEDVLRKNTLNMKDREVDRKRKILESKIADLRTEFESTEEELNKITIEADLVKKVTEENRLELIKRRKGEQSGK